ncbi:MAG: SH3 domain-containing protein [Caldilineaceae bacterium]|nr:SH3 domain-containing protein [Caldilineaceae bacterium]
MFRYFYRLVAVGLTLLLCYGQHAPAIAQDTTPAPERPLIRIGSKELNEQLLLGKMLVLLLQEAGYPVEDHTATGGSRAVRTALENGEIDLYPEYTGTALSLYHELPNEALPNTPARSYELAKSLDVPLGFVWLTPAAINNPFTLLVRPDLSDQGLLTLADLADYMNANDSSLTICVESEFFSRQDGLTGLQTAYGFAFPEENILVMEPNETYNNLRTGNCDVAEGYATDGRISAWGFTALTDPLAFFPASQPTPVLRQALLDSYPELTELINGLWQYLDNDTMIALNTRVDIGADGVLGNGDEELAEAVAYSFLVSKRLIQPAAIKVGSKELNEQLLMGKMIILLLQDAGVAVEDLTGLGGSPAVRAALEEGVIDLYPEYTGTATSLHHSLPVSALPADAHRTYLLAKSLDAAQGLIWLDAAPLNNTFTLLVRQELADQGIVTLEDLAVYMNENDAPLKICVEGEFFGRQDGLVGLQELYDFTFQEENILVMEPNETYANLRNGTCEVAEGFATDGRINAWGFHNLQDPLAFFPFYQPAPVIREETLALYPEIVAPLNRLMQGLDDATMSRLNAQVDLGPDGELASGDELSVEDVAYRYLREQRLIKLPNLVISAADTVASDQQLLSKMLLVYLADRGYQTVDQTGLGSGILVREALQKGEIDLYMEAVATALAYAGLPVTALPTDAERAYQLIKSLDAANEIAWLAPTAYRSTYGVVAQPELLDLGIRDLAQLAAYMNENDAPLSICMDNDFYSRALNGLAGLEEIYAFHFAPENIYLIDTEDIYGSFANGECDVAAGLTLEALIHQYTILADPLFFFPTSVVAPVTRQAVLERDPELAESLARLSALITTEAMIELEKAVKIGPDGVRNSGDETPIDAVVVDFLLAHELITTAPATNSAPDDAASDAPELQAPATLTTTTPVTDTAAPTDAVGAAGPIVVASMNYPEQALFGKLLVQLLQGAGYAVVDQTNAGSSVDLRSALEQGEIDLYPEFPRTALTFFHNLPAVALPQASDELYTLAKSFDEPYALVWLRKASFDSAYGLLMRQEAVDLGIGTLDDLADYLADSAANLHFCAEADFVDRAESDLTTMLAAYPITMDANAITTLPADEIYRALRDGECDVAVAWPTDSRVSAWQLVALADPLAAFPSYSPAPVIRQATLAQYPAIEAAINQLSGLLDAEAIATLSARVELGADLAEDTGDEETLAAVATAFLCDYELIPSCDQPAAALPVTAPATATLPAASDAALPIIEITTPDTYGVNARASASIGATVVTVLARNTTFRAIGRTSDGNWLQIQLPDDQLVWVFTAAVVSNPQTLPLLPLLNP